MGSSDPDKLDLTAYRTDELVSSFASLISIPTALRTLLATVALSVVAALLTMAVFLASRGAASSVTWTGGLLYALFAGVILGIGGGLLRVMYRSITSSREILGLVTGMSRRIASDQAALRAGARQLPDPADLMRQVYQGILVPTVEKTARKTLGFLAPPLIAVLRTVIGPAVRGLSQLVNSSAITRQINSLIPSGAAVVGGTATHVEQWSQRVDATMSIADEVSGTISRRLTTLILVPAIGLFALVLLLTLLPIGVALIAGWI